MSQKMSQTKVSLNMSLNVSLKFSEKNVPLIMSQVALLILSSYFNQKLSQVNFGLKIILGDLCAQSQHYEVGRRPFHAFL